MYCVDLEGPVKNSTWPGSYSDFVGTIRTHQMTFLSPACWIFLEDTNKQTVGTYQNKGFHKSTISAKYEPSKTFLGRG